MLYRIMKIKISTEVVLCEAVNESFEKITLLFSRPAFDEYKIIPSSTIIANCERIKDFKGRDIDQVLSVDKVMTHNDKEPYSSSQSIYYSNKKYLNKNFKSAIDGGSSLQNWRFRQIFISEIKKYLASKRYFDINTPLLMEERGTSIVNPMKVSTTYNNEHYLKLTHEMELRKICYLTLQSVFEVGYVARDIYGTTSDLYQYLSLETVGSPTNDLRSEDFYLHAYQIAKEIAKECELIGFENIPEVEIVDVLESFSKCNDEYDKEEFISFYTQLVKSCKERNVIFINAPVKTPLAKDSEWGIPLETKWRILGDGVGHGYFSETNYEKLKAAFQEQVNLLNAKGVNVNIPESELKALLYAGMDTYNFNLGLDRFFYKFSGEGPIKNSAKILGI